MKRMHDFIVFVNEEMLDVAVAKQYDMFKSLGVAIWNNIEQNNETHLTDIIRSSFLRTLQSLKDDNAYNYIQESITEWEKSQLGTAAEQQASFEDVIQIAHIQKKVLLQLLPYFTNDVEVATEIAIEIEELSNSMQLASARSFTNIQHKVYKEFHNSEENFKALFDNAHDLIHIIKPDGKILYVNNAWLEVLGYTQDEIKEKSIYSLVHEKSRHLFRKYRDNILENRNDLQEVTITMCTKNNEEVIVQGFVLAQFEKGKPVFTRGIFRDITVQVKYEERLQTYTNQILEREENLQLIINNAPDAVIVIDENSFITFWNPKAEMIFGWTAAEVIGKPLSNYIVPPRYRDAHLNGMRRYLSTGKAHMLNKTIEISAINKLEKEFYISLTISATNQGGKKAFVSFIRDNTLLKENEIELEKQRQELEQSARELEQYTWLTSHDLREPLRKVLTYSDMLLTKEKESLSGNVIKHIKKIQESGQRMNNLIKAVLNYSSLSDSSVFYTPTDLNLIINDVLIDLELVIKENNATVTLQKLPVIDAVAFQMQQLFLNLISNAIKYRKQTVNPNIAVTHNYISEHIIEISVTDNGSGFEMRNEDKIFKLFQRLDNHNKSGTGIGLALCKKIVQNHKGRIWVKSEVAVGSTFFIQLPVTQN